MNEYIDSTKSGRKIKSGDFITEPQMYRLAIKDHVDFEDKMGAQNGTPSITDSLGRNQKPTWIFEHIQNN